MGKRIISQARGKGGPAYKVKKQAFSFRVGYPISLNGELKVIKLIHSAAHSAPLMKICCENKIFYNVAFDGVFEGQIIKNNKNDYGNILMLKEIQPGTKIYNIEINPGDGGKMIRAAGTSATVAKKYENNKIGVILNNKREIVLDGNCRATIGIIAGDGRTQKPFFTAGKKFHKIKARGGKLWPRTSAVKMNAVDHPFGSGRGKRIKSKIVKRWAPAGRRVGHLKPRRTGKK